MTQTILSGFGTIAADSKSATQPLSRISEKEMSEVDFVFGAGEPEMPVISRIAKVLDLLIDGKKGTLVLVTTVLVNSDLQNPKVGPAVSWFLLDEKRSKVVASTKYFGSFGFFSELSEVKSIPLGPKDSGIEFSTSIMHGGISYTFVDLHIMQKDKLESVLFYTEETDNSGLYGDERPDLLAENKTAFSLVAGSGNRLPDIELRTTGKELIQAALYPEAAVHVDRTERYTFADGKYRLQSVRQEAVKEYFFPIKLLLDTEEGKADGVYIFGWSTDGKLAWARVQPPNGAVKETPVIEFLIVDAKTGKFISKKEYDIATLYNKGILDGGEETDGFDLALTDSGFGKELRKNNIQQFEYANVQIFPVKCELRQAETFTIETKSSGLVLVSDHKANIPVKGSLKGQNPLGLAVAPDQRFAALIVSSKKAGYTNVNLLPVRLGD